MICEGPIPHVRVTSINTIKNIVIEINPVTIVDTVKLINIVQLIVREALEISLLVNALTSGRFDNFEDI